MKTLQQKLSKSQKKLDTIQGFNQQQIQIVPFDEREDRREQMVSILSRKPVVEFEVQISKSISATMEVYDDSQPEELVEEFISLHSMKPQAFNPILQMILEKMKELEDNNNILFTNLREDSYYQLLMKKQQALCQEYQQTKELLRLEKLRGEQLVKSRQQYNSQVPSDSSSSFTHPQRDNEENERQIYSSRGIKESDKFKQNEKQPPRQEQKGFERTQSLRDFNNSKREETGEKEKRPKKEEEPLFVFYNHLNSSQKSSTKENKTLKNSKSSRDPVKEKSKERQISPRPIITVKKSPLKQPNEESYLEKGEKRKSYYQDGKNVSERLYNQGKKPPHCGRSEFQDDQEKECTFMPKINENSKNLSKQYYQRKNVPVPTPFEDPIKEIRRVPERQQIFQADQSIQTSEFEKDIGLQTNDSLNQNYLNYLQMQEEEEERLRQQQRKLPRFEEFGVQTSQGLVPTKSTQVQASVPQKSEFIQTYSSPKYDFGGQTLANPQQSSAIQTSQGLIPLTSTGIQTMQNPIEQRTAGNQTADFSVQKKSMSIQTSQLSRTSKYAQTSQSVKASKQSFGIQTSEQNLDPSYEQSQNINFDPNLNKNYFKYLQIQEDAKLDKFNPLFNNENSSQQSNCNQSLTKYLPPIQQIQPITKQSATVQTSDWLLQNEVQSPISSRQDSEKRPNNFVFDPSLNKNYFKFLQMEEDKLKENEVPVSSIHDSDNKPTQIIFDPSLNKNYFKFLEMEEEKQKENGDSYKPYLSNNYSLPTPEHVNYDTFPPYNTHYEQIEQVPENANASPPYKNYYQNEDIEEGSKYAYAEQDFSSPQQNASQNYQFKPYQSEVPSYQNQYSVPLQEASKYETPYTPKSDLKSTFIPLSEYEKPNNDWTNVSRNDFLSPQIQDVLAPKTKENQYDYNYLPTNPVSPEIYVIPTENQNPNQLREFSIKGIEQQNPPALVNRESFTKYNDKNNKQNDSFGDSNPQAIYNNKDSFSKPDNQGNLAESQQSKNYREEGSVYYCDEEAMSLQSDHPFASSGASAQVGLSSNFLNSIQKFPQSTQVEQKPDISISCVRSVSPRIDNNVRVSTMVSCNRPENNFTKPQGFESNQFKLQVPQLVKSVSHTMLFQSKLRGQLSDREQDALEIIFNEILSCSKDKQILKKSEIDSDLLPFGVILKSHLEIILKQFQPNEIISLQSFFAAAERSNSLSLFLCECMEYVDSKEQYS